MRSIFTRERRCAPALLIVGACAALAAAGALAWVWLAVFAANVLARAWVAHGLVESDEIPALKSRPTIVFFASHAADIALWMAYFAGVGTPAQIFSGGGVFAAAGAMLLAALAFGGWKPVWLPMLAGWICVTIVLLMRAPAAEHPAVALFPLWVGSVWWLGSRRSRAAQLRESRTTIAQRTRLGWNTAIAAMPTPLIIVRNGRIADINQPASLHFGRDELSMIGRRAEDCFDIDPPEALDPARAPRDSTAVTLTPILANADTTPWTARVRMLEPGSAGTIFVIALLRHTASAAVDGVAAEAKRFAAAVGGGKARAWYRDEQGKLVVPSGLPLPPVAYLDKEFPLSYCTLADERGRLNEAWQGVLDGQQPVFDERVTLVDVLGALRPVRIVAVVRPSSGTHPGAVPVIGVIAAAVSPAQGADATLAEVSRQLPVLIWLVDAAGRVVYAQGREAWRWGMQRMPDERPLWFDAFTLHNGARVDVQTALQRALAGRATYDLINSRTTRTGGRIVLRSHFVPFKGATLAGLAHAGTLVLDTIAAPEQLAEIDRLRRSKAQYRALVEASTSLIWACDAQFKLTFVSRRAVREIYGYEPEELIGQSISILFPTGDQKPARQTLAKLRLGETLRNVEMVHAAKNGSRLVVSVSAVPMHASDGGFGGAIGMNADLTVLKLRERRLTEALRIERTVLDSAGQALAVVKDGLVARCNDAFLSLLQADPASLARSPLADYFATVDEWTAITEAADAARAQDRATTREVQVRRGSRATGHSTAWCQLTARAIAPGEYVVVLADIDHIRQREEEALHDANHDELTGLPNRRLLASRAASALAATALRNARCALFAIDLDGFKDINDRHGHDVGDRVLREIAARLARAMRPQDTVARRGGDEFAVLVPDTGHRVDIERIAFRLLASLESPIVVGDTSFAVSASVGIALAPDHGVDLERLLQLADLAMYDAKLRGKNRFAFAAEAGGEITTPAPRAAGAA